MRGVFGEILKKKKDVSLVFAFFHILYIANTISRKVLALEHQINMSV